MLGSATFMTVLSSPMTTRLSESTPSVFQRRARCTGSIVISLAPFLTAVVLHGGNVGAGVPARIRGTAGAVTRAAIGAGWAQQLAEASAWPIWPRQLAASRVAAFWPREGDP